MNRDYNCAQEDSKIKYLTDRPVQQLRLKYRHTKGARIDEQTFSTDQIAIRGPKTRGIQVTKRTVTSVVAKAE
jgi:hypothetical protein